MGVTTRNGFINRIEDVTFYGGRMQSEVLKERGMDSKQEGEVEAPVSTTPEAIETFLLKKAVSAPSKEEKKAYMAAALYIQDREKQRGEIKSLNDKLSRYVAVSADSVEEDSDEC